MADHPTPVDLSEMRAAFPPADPDAADFLVVLDALAVAVEALRQAREQSDQHGVQCQIDADLARIRELVTPEAVQ